MVLGNIIHDILYQDNIYNMKRIYYVHIPNLCLPAKILKK